VAAEAGVSTRWPVIGKDPGALRVPPHLADYEATRAAFTWAQARQALDGLPGGGLNIAHEAVDRHAAGPRGGQEALRFVRVDGSTHSYSYADLAEQ
jgi:acetyl-CoA synthetase